MARPARDVTEAALAVPRVLGERPVATTRPLTDVLYPGGTAARYATLQKLRARMEA